MSTATVSTVSQQAPQARRLTGTRVPCYVFDSHRDLARSVAQTVAGVIRERNSLGHHAVLGLAAGRTTVGVYRELARLHRDEGLDFSGVVTFNLDEYYGLSPEQTQSHQYWMQETFFGDVNIPSRNINMPYGTVPGGEVAEYCRQYEELIERAGGIDVMLLGIGRDGHIGFNEPFSPRNGRTQLVTLDPVTRIDAAGEFFGEDNVPTQAITMGLGTIMDARKIILIALGEGKASIIRQAVEGPLDDRVPASLLREHGDVSFLLDRAAAAELTASCTPWKLGNVEWTEPLIKRAALWLSEQSEKALLKLDDCDFREHGLHQLLREHGPAQEAAHQVFRWMMETIEYHPAGRGRKRVICFSPHPDDDVISMGGTLIRLVDDGHDVHVAYMTSGNIAVFDHDAQRVADLVAEYNRTFGIDDAKSLDVEARVFQTLGMKKPGEPDNSEDVLRIKGLIRWSEAKAGAKACGIREENLRFLDLPFYRTGAIAKHPLKRDDIKIVRECIERVDPHQIYVAGDLSDPHGTHRICAEAIFQALAEMKDETGNRPEVLLYRGAWEEWPMHEIEIAVPLSPRDVAKKKAAIFRHQSQKDTALFPGSDKREFWQRAEDRNRHTACLYNQMGLPEYYAMEAFVRWNGERI
jgi:glucosamine-6-phosphate deaminase